MEAQNVPALHLRQRFIFRNQRFQLGANLICRQHEGYFAGGFGTAVLTRRNPFPAVIHRAKDELVVKILNEFRSQRFLRMVEDVIYADTVVQDLHQIGHLHGLKLTNITDVAKNQDTKEEKQKVRLNGFNSIFAVSSIDAAKLY